MGQMTDKLKKEFWTKEFILFVVVGVVNTLDCSLFAAVLMQYGIEDANILAYLLNCWLIFPTRPQLYQYFKFALSYVGNAIIENVSVLVLYNWLGFPPVVSFVLAALISVPVTFLMVKIYAFSKK